MKSAIKQVKSKLGASRARFKTPIPRPWFPASSPQLLKTLLITCQPGFNQEFPIAASLMRVGFARGWAEACGPAKLIPIWRLMHEIDGYDNPAVFMSEFEFAHLSYADAKRLRNVDLFVWVGIHPRMYPKWENLVLYNPGELEISLNAYAKITIAQPNFVWNAVGEAAREWYQGWRDDGFRWETIYPGVDTYRYFPDFAFEKFGNIKMAYVGGYWAEKAQGFDMYLKPWEDILVPYGYAKWPYKNYGGQLNEAGERQLYSSAGLIPLVTGPAGWLIAEITERYLKAPACRAFCIADHNHALREVFREDEMIQAESPEHFHQLVRDFIDGKIDSSRWAEKFYEAVKTRHLYSHRALQIKNALARNG